MEKKSYSHLDFNQRKNFLEIFEYCCDNQKVPDFSSIAEHFNVSVRTIQRMKQFQQRWKEK